MCLRGRFSLLLVYNVGPVDQHHWLHRLGLHAVDEEVVLRKGFGGAVAKYGSFSSELMSVD